MTKDVMTVEQRKKAMRSNRGRTGPERKLASGLWHEGFRFVTAEGYRKRFGNRLPGQPDLIFTKKMAVVFVDGCFWHGCRRCHDFGRDCSPFWQQKIDTNVKRDRRISLTLRRQGWKVIRVWEHDLRKASRLDATVKRVSSALWAIDENRTSTNRRNRVQR